MTVPLRDKERWSSVSQQKNLKKIQGYVVIEKKWKTPSIFENMD